MPETSYILAALGICFAITLSLRAVPFLVLSRLRESVFVRHMSMWMPAGILVILAATTFRSSAFDDSFRLWEATAASVVTVVVHLVCGRRTLLSVAAGTITFVALVNLL